MNPDFRFLVTVRCPDRQGIVAALSSFLAEHNFSIVEAHQHESAIDRMFFMRVAFTGSEPSSPSLDRVALAFQPLAERFAMQVQFRDLSVRPRVVILVSKFGHCLQDLLLRRQAGQLAIDVPAVISNHEDMRSFTEWCGVPYHYLPVSATNRATQEDQIRDLVRLHDADLVVLARYMQVLSPALSTEFEGRCINIHHSFLPGFKGAKPYHQAHASGVKIIGATAHYVTSDLDEGPIIEQETRRVSHTRSPEELVEIGQEVERSVLTRAVRWHLEGRIFVSGTRTVVFD